MSKFYKVLAKSKTKKKKRTPLKNGERTSIDISPRTYGWQIDILKDAQCH